MSDLWFLVYKLLFSSCNGNFLSIDDFAIEECSRKRDAEKAALSSMITTVGNRFDLHLSVLARQDDVESDKTVSVTCSKIERAVELSVADRSNRARVLE